MNAKANRIGKRQRESGQRAPVFLLSFRHRDDLAATLSRAGWNVVPARRSTGAEQRFIASGAFIALVDARGELDEALAATERLAGHVGSCGGELLVLVSRASAGALDAFLSAGATQFLTSPVSQSELVHAVRFAEAHGLRNRNGYTGADDLLTWRWDPDRGVTPGPALAERLGIDGPLGVAPSLRLLDRAGRRAAIRRLRSLRSNVAATAFHAVLPSIGEAVHHITRSRSGRGIHAVLERAVDDDQLPMTRDWLTGMRDAAAARKWLELRFADGEAQVAILLVGLARFEVVNASLGRTAGDAVLRSVSTRLEELARERFGGDALAARLGGSDFAIAANCDLAAMRSFGERIEQAFAEPFATETGTATVGVHLSRAERIGGDHAASLLRRAAEGLANAREGRASSMSDPEHRERERLSLDIRAALEEGQIAIRFQPQARIADGRIVGVEALARWLHPDLGELGAEPLLDAARRAGLSDALSDAIHRAALHEAVRWPGALHHLRVSMNITAADVARPGFADHLLGRIDASGIARERLTLEVTETGLMEDLKAASDLFAQLRRAGCRIAIDDFGTGYSSLAYLQSLPLDYIKIDRKLSQDMAGDARDRVVVRGVIEMAHSLGLGLIAEGVETEEQLALLAEQGCETYQGFLCAGPLTSDELADRVGEENAA